MLIIHGGMRPEVFLLGVKSLSLFSLQVLSLLLLLLQVLSLQSFVMVGAPVPPRGSPAVPAWPSDAPVPGRVPLAPTLVCQLCFAGTPPPPAAFSAFLATQPPLHGFGSGPLSAVWTDIPQTKSSFSA